MSDNKKTSPQMLACGSVLSTVAEALADIGRLANAAINMDHTEERSAALEAIKAMAHRAGALADLAAAATGAMPYSDIDDWTLGQRGAEDIAAISVAKSEH